MKTSIYNIEARIGKNGKAYIMEVSPRGGGNRLAECLKLATGVDLIKASVQAALGEEIDYVEQRPYNGFWSIVVIHSLKDGVFEDIIIDKDIEKNNIKDITLFVSKGDNINAFRAANDSLGTLFLRFDTKEELEYALNNQDKWLEIKLK